MATYKSSIVWDDVEHPIVHSGMINHSGSDADYLRRCVEFYETHHDQESIILRVLARIEGKIDNGVSINNSPPPKTEIPDDNSHEIFDEAIEQLRSNQNDTFTSLDR